MGSTSGVEQLPQEGPPATSPDRRCVTCGRAIEWRMNVCPYCGHDYRVVAGPPTKPRTSKPVIGGTLVILAGILALAMGVFYIVVEPSDLENLGYSPVSEADLSLSEVVDILGTCGIIEIVIGLIAIVGGAFAIMRKRFGLAIAGAVVGMIGVGFLVGGLLGLVGLILIAISRSEF